MRTYCIFIMNNDYKKKKKKKKKKKNSAGIRVGNDSPPEPIL